MSVHLHLLKQGGAQLLASASVLTLLILHAVCCLMITLLLTIAELQDRFWRKGVGVKNWDHLMSWLAPAQRGSHMPWWTFIVSLVNSCMLMLMSS